MKKILFVCTGNICRSPMAEGILREKLARKGIDAEVDSCGFESFHEGDAPDPRAMKVSRDHGVDISRHRARLFTTDDLDRFHAIYVMDSGHYRKVMNHCRNGEDRDKVDFLMNVLYPGQNIPVQDPWYHDLDAFQLVYSQMEEACEKIAKKISDAG